ncbi:ATPase [Vibrio campbellii]|uniref:Diphthamide synthase domain-containing protein n=1 Tax=Vibrio campbellii (strain ATCC BAA-1116) TaxID=2902295 RepID=A7MXY4_VIBC1|nr:hypothetical protein VIBHAR_00258 [Vibrio campbellii ATCC BAA-1116]
MTKAKRVVVSWSSGKDSTLTLERLNENPPFARRREQGIGI